MFLADAAWLPPPPHTWWWWTALALEICSIAFIPHVLLHKRNPLSALSWIWALLLFPVIAPLFYLVFGNERLQRRTLRKRRGATPVEVPVPLPEETHPAEVLPPVAERLERLCRGEFVAGGRLEVIPDSAKFFEALAEEINRAKEHIHLEYFIWRHDKVGKRLGEALLRAQRRGVEVRCLFDELGSLRLRLSEFSELTAAGGEVSWFTSVSPLRQRWFLHLRNHRKLAVFDGRVAFLGGMNVGEQYLPWRDFSVRVEGPAVESLQRAFADDWFFATTRRLTAAKYYPPVAPAGSVETLTLAAGPDQDVFAHRIRIAILGLAHEARHRLWIASPYLVPDPAISAALQVAARIGVDVRLLLPRKPDSIYLASVARSFYEELLDAGVRIYEYLPRMMHSKVLLQDDALGMIGSANLDVRSLKLNFELNLLFHDRATVAEVSALLREDFRQSEEIKRVAFARRGIGARLLEGALRLLAPVL